jgi:hypothetical protein
MGLNVAPRKAGPALPLMPTFLAAGPLLATATRESVQ